MRIELPEVPQDLRQLGEGEVIGRAEAQASAHGRPGEVARGLVVRGQDRARETEQRMPVVGQARLTRVPHDQVAPSGHLESADVLAHGGLAQSEPGCRAREARGSRRA